MNKNKQNKQIKEIIVNGIFTVEITTRNVQTKLNAKIETVCLQLSIQQHTYIKHW